MKVHHVVPDFTWTPPKEPQARRLVVEYERPAWLEMAETLATTVLLAIVSALLLVLFLSAGSQA